MRVLLAVIAVSLVIVVPATASADMADCPKKLEKTYSSFYKKVAKKHGKRAPGRNIRENGVLFRKVVFRATCGELRRSRSQLKKLNRREPYIAFSDVPPAQPPSGVRSVGMAPSGLASCIISAESGGNTQATNGQYGGIAQWSPEAWARHGGLRYASSPIGATYEQQLEVLNNGLKNYGCRDWCPFDGC